MTQIPFFAVNQSNQGPSSTQYRCIGSGQLVAETFETNAQVKWEAAGTFSNLYVNVNTNSLSATTTVRFRVNTADGNQNLSIGSGATGEFQDVTNSDTLAAGDLIALKNVAGAGGTTLTAFTYSFQFAPTSGSDTVNKPLAGNNTNFAHATTYYAPLGGHLNTTSATEANAQFTNRATATLRNLMVNVNTNGVTATSTVKSRVNGAAGNLTLSVGTSATGKFEDTTHTDSIVAGDLPCYEIACGATGGNLTTEVVCCDYYTTTGKTQYIGGGTNGANQIFASTTRYLPVVQGNLSPDATESKVQSKAQIAFTASNLFCGISANTISATSTVKFRLNAGNGNQVLSIGASATGYFEDTTHSDSVIATDEINYQLVGGVGGTSATTTVTGFLADFGGGGGGPTYTLATSVGTFTLTGVAAAFKAARNLVAGTGAFTLTGNAASFVHSYPMVAGTGSFTLSGIAASLTAARKLATSVGTFTLTGNAAALKAARNLAAGTGSFALTGNDATLVYTPSGNTYTMSAGTGSFLLTGFAASFTAPQQASAGRTQKKRWSVKTGLGLEYFDTAEQAHAFLEGIEAQDRPKERIRSDSKRVVSLGATPVAEYDGIDLASVSVKGRSGMTVLREGDDRLLRLLVLAVQRRIELEQQDEDEAIALLLLTQ